MSKSKKNNKQIDIINTTNTADITNQVLTIEQELINISEELTILNQTSKLQDILKKHGIIKTNLNDMTNRVDLIKSSFESITDISKEIIDDETYNKYSQEIATIFETNFDQMDVETMVTTYKTISKKIYSCDNYLKSKKIEIIDCDKKQLNQSNNTLDDKSMSSESVSSDDSD